MRAYILAAINSVAIARTFLVFSRNSSFILLVTFTKKNPTSVETKVFRRKVLSLSLLDNRHLQLLQRVVGIRQTAILGSRPQTVAEVLFNGAKAREREREETSTTI